MLSAGDRVLVRVPTWLGDAVMAEPAIRALAERVGPVNLTLAGPEPLTRLLAEQQPGSRSLRANDVAQWRGHDVAVLLTNSFRSAWYAWRARIPRRVGWARDGRGALLSDAVRPAREVGRTPLRLGRRGEWPRALPRPFGAACVELVGLLGVGVPETRPCLVASPAAREACACRLAGFGLRPGEPYLVASVGSRPGSAKGYPPQSWADAIARLRRDAGLPVVLAGGPGEEASVEEVVRALANGPGAPVHACLAPVAGLGELLALLGGARLALVTDSGPRHLAVAAGVPIVAIAGPTDPRHTADHLDRTLLLREPVDCGPCHLEECPLEGEAWHACMRNVAPERVAAAGLGFLGVRR